MHFLDDRVVMDALFHDSPRQYLYLARLALAGGEAPLNAKDLATRLNVVYPAMIQWEIDQLVTQGKIERLSNFNYKITAWEVSSFAAPKKTATIVTNPFPQPKEPSFAAFQVVRAYQTDVKKGGAVLVAAQRVQDLLDSGNWTTDRLLACVNAYGKELRDGGMARLAVNFFEPLPHGLFWGSQYEPAAKLEKPVNDDDVAAMAAALKAKRAGK